MKNLTGENLINSTPTNLRQQVKIVVLAFWLTIIPVSLIFIIFKLITKLSINLLTRDPLVITNAHFYIGMISNIGILFWCAGAAICLFSYAIVKRNNLPRELTKFLLFSGLLTSFLTIDDLFMLHDVVFPEYLYINEYLIYVVYLGIVLSFFIKNLKFIKKTEFIILLAATGFFALSIIFDTLFAELPTFIDDIFKLLGIITWFTYFSRLCLRELSSVIRLSSSSKLFP